jgi:N-methylhydantoinase B
MLESTYPIIVERVELVKDSGGPGRHRGGVGSRTHFRLAAPAFFFCIIERGKAPHWGLFGGGEGLRNYAVVRSGRKGEFEVLKDPGIDLDEGDRVVVTAGGGGGYGDPLDRDPEAVRSDVIEGYVSLERARLDYGVALLAGTFEIDREATRLLRDSLRDNS